MKTPTLEIENVVPNSKNTYTKNVRFSYKYLNIRAVDLFLIA